MNASTVAIPVRRLGLCCTLLAATSGWAQQDLPTDQTSAIVITDQAPAFRQFDKVEITGSSIVRKEQTQALPVQVITREDIRRSGLRSMADVLQALPSISNFVEPSQLTMIVGGYSSAAIHGLPTGTLVLVNGLRMAPFGRPTMVGPERSSVDLQTLPLADVERIEILADGASSLYGTDAIAGVVNIILRTNRKDVEIRADLSRPDGGRGQAWSSSVSWGRGQLQRDGHSFLMTFEAAGRQELMASDRPYINQGRYTFEHQGQRYSYEDFLSRSGSPATLEQRDAAGVPVRWANNLYQNGQCTSNSVPMPGQPACMTNLGATKGIYPKEDHQRLHARTDIAIGNGWTGFGELLLGRSLQSVGFKSWTSIASAYGLPEGSQAYNQALQAGLDPANTRLLWRPDLPGWRLASEQTNGRLSFGLKGESDGWDHRSQLYMARSHAQNLYSPRGTLYDSVGLTDGAVWNNAQVLSPLDAKNPLTDAVTGLKGQSPESAGTNTIYGLQVHGSRPLAEWQGRDVLLGIGMDWRQEQTDYTNQSNPFNYGQPSLSARRQVMAGFAELQLPVTPTWEAQLGLRGDHYQDIGDTLNGKLATRWIIDPQWSMRGAIGTGFRAPSVAQTHSSSSPFRSGTFGIAMACTAEQQAIAQTLKAAGGTSGVCVPSSTVLVLGNGNPELKPEKSTQINWGLAFVPDRNLRLAADFWAVRIENSIQMANIEAILASPSQYTANYVLMPDAIAQAYKLPSRSLTVFLPMQNLGAQEKAGLDLEVQWRRPTEWGLWHLQAQATYMLRSRMQTAPGNPYTSDLGQFDIGSMNAAQRWRSRIVGGLNQTNWSLYATMNHIGGYRDLAVDATNLNTGLVESVQRDVASFTTWDLVFQTSVHTGVDLRLGVRNVFNRPAPLSFASISQQLQGANAVYSNVWGRVVELGLTARF